VRQLTLRLATRSRTVRPLALEHLEHAVGDEKATDDVDRAERDGDHQQDLVEDAVAAGADHQQAAEQHDPVDRVGAGHQRRVQRVGDLRDHGEADEAGEHEDGDLDDERKAVAVVHQVS